MAPKKMSKKEDDEHTVEGVIGRRRRDSEIPSEDDGRGAKRAKAAPATRNTRKTNGKAASQSQSGSDESDKESSKMLGNAKRRKVDDGTISTRSSSRASSVPTAVRRSRRVHPEDMSCQEGSVTRSASARPRRAAAASRFDRKEGDSDEEDTVASRRSERSYSRSRDFPGFTEDEEGSELYVDPRNPSRVLRMTSKRRRAVSQDGSESGGEEKATRGRGRPKKTAKVDSDSAKEEEELRRRMPARKANGTLNKYRRWPDKAEDDGVRRSTRTPSQAARPRAESAGSESAEEAKRGRGRPKKGIPVNDSDGEEESTVSRRSGRPANGSAKKRTAPASSDEDEEGGVRRSKRTPSQAARPRAESAGSESEEETKRGRGRPKKAIPVNDSADEEETTASRRSARRSNGSTKARAAPASSDEEEDGGVRRSKRTPKQAARGSTKSQSTEGSESGGEEKATRGRGRPRKTANVDVDSDEEEETMVSRRSARRSNGSAKTRATVASSDEDEGVRRSTRTSSSQSARRVASTPAMDDAEEGEKKAEAGGVKRIRRSGRRLSSDENESDDGSVTGVLLSRSNSRRSAIAKDEEEEESSDAEKKEKEKSSAATRQRGRPRRSAGNADVDVDQLATVLASLVSVHPFVAPSEYTPGNVTKFAEQLGSTPPKVLKMEDLPGIKLWTEAVYKKDGNDMIEKDRFRGRDVERIVGRVTQQKDSFVLVHLAAKKNEVSPSITELVVAVVESLATRLFPKAYTKMKARAAVAAMSSASSTEDDDDEQPGPSTRSATRRSAGAGTRGAALGPTPARTSGGRGRRVLDDSD